MVPSTHKHAVLTRAYLAWSMATCSSTVSQGSGLSYPKRVQAIMASCAPKLAAVPAPAPDGGGQGEEEMEA